jgi:hypothetical protein
MKSVTHVSEQLLPMCPVHTHLDPSHPYFRQFRKPKMFKDGTRDPSYEIRHIFFGQSLSVAWAHGSQSFSVLGKHTQGCSRQSIDQSA